MITLERFSLRFRWDRNPSSPPPPHSGLMDRRRRVVQKWRRRKVGKFRRDVGRTRETKVEGEIANLGIFVKKSSRGSSASRFSRNSQVPGVPRFLIEHRGPGVPLRYFKTRKREFAVGTLLLPANSSQHRDRTDLLPGVRGDKGSRASIPGLYVDPEGPHKYKHLLLSSIRSKRWWDDGKWAK